MSGDQQLGLHSFNTRPCKKFGGSATGTVFSETGLNIQYTSFVKGSSVEVSSHYIGFKSHHNCTVQDFLFYFLSGIVAILSYSIPVLVFF